MQLTISDKLEAFGKDVQFCIERLDTSVHTDSCRHMDAIVVHVDGRYKDIRFVGALPMEWRVIGQNSSRYRDLVIETSRRLLAEMQDFKLSKLRNEKFPSEIES